MSLSARIVLDPSRRVAAMEAFFPLAGFCLASFAVARRSFRLELPLTLFAVAFAAVFVAVAWSKRSPPRRTLVVSDRLDVGVADAEAAPDGEMRVVASTLLWPSIAVLALSRPGDAAIVRWPVALGELAPRDRRALSRYLGWVLRGGGDRGGHHANGT
jgi:hypothetical protein